MPPPASSIDPNLLRLKLEMIEWADGSVAGTVDYIRREKLCHRSISAFAGYITLAHCHFLANGSFLFADAGELAAVIEVIEITPENDPAAVDLVAWPIEEPAFFATATGRGLALGGDAIRNPASFFSGAALRVHRTPLAWLRASCTGVCILDQVATAEALGAALGPILAEDRAHALGLREHFRGADRKPRIGYPATKVFEAA